MTQGMQSAHDIVALPSPSDEIAFCRRGGVGVVTLRRPKALNALTLEMIRAFRPVLDEWAADPAIGVVVIEGEGDRAFCAGGDVRAVWEAGKHAQAEGGFDPLTCPDDALPRRFFFEEYQLNRAIHAFPKPYIAILDGVTMGGGVGLSIHGSHRVATDRVLCAMPETAIGLFPDVGASWSLPRMPGSLGLYFALTGARAKTADAVYAGFATHAMDHGAVSDLIDMLAAEDWMQTLDAAARVDSIVARFARDPGPAPLSAHRAIIDRCFSKDNVPAILAALEAEREGPDAAFVQETLSVLSTRSPTSMMLACTELQRGAELSFDDCMVMEFRLAQFCMAGDDFYEGIRAVLIDKDHAPKWRPERLGDVDPALIESAFAPLGDRDLRF